MAWVKKIPSSDSTPRHGLRFCPRSHEQRGRCVRVEERRFMGFLDLRERSSLLGNAPGAVLTPAGKVFVIMIMYSLAM
jgi:hypothetical protein